MNLVDDARDKLDEAGEAVKDMANDTENKIHEKKGEMQGRADQAEEDMDEEDMDGDE